MADELQSVRKELQTVKKRAVEKIKALQAQVDDLTTQLAESKARESSSEDGSEKSGGFVKVDDPAKEASLSRRERELDAREAALAQQEEALQRRERELGVGSASAAQQQPSAICGWEGSLRQSLREVNANLQQVEIAVESAGV